MGAFWLSPRQAMVVPVGLPFNSYAKEVSDMMRARGFCVEADTDDGNTMNKKVRNAQLAQYNFIFVVGQNEGDNRVHGEFSLEAVLDKFQELTEQRILKSEDYGWSPPSDSDDSKSKSATPMSE